MDDRSMKKKKGQRVVPSTFLGCTSSRTIEIEFSLALNNRTGKYFVCSDLIEAVDEFTENIWYWRMRSATRSRWVDRSNSRPANDYRVRHAHWLPGIGRRIGKTLASKPDAIYRPAASSVL